MQSTSDYEKLGAFYLGKQYDLDRDQRLDQWLLYDSQDLTTHALCVGMTGSGKTGLCLALLEEAAIDGIPAICLDPKGDLGNLLLSFPNLSADDFLPWIDAAEAKRRELSPEDYAQQVAASWQRGLSDWDQTAERIARFRNSVDMAIYTPGSQSGLPLSVLKNFAAPDPAVLQDAELLRQRASGAASAVLTLLAMEADPLNSRPHILLATIFEQAWRAGQDLDLPALIRYVQSPPFAKVGVFDLESFLPAGERRQLALAINNLLASPSFAGWLEGQPLDIGQLLYTPQGKPRLSIISVAHLNDAERQSFVTVLLGELLAWMRSQPGTSSLRAVFYMDEVFGFFPPVANPPTKAPMLMLLKQARAFGLGIVLATQNPVDLDYKGLSNIGTWFLGRLQTARDQQRVLDGLEGAATQSGHPLDRSRLQSILAGLGKRTFLLHNVHADAPSVFQTRWVLSYLRGPLTGPQIQQLMDPLRRAPAAGTTPQPATAERAGRLPPSGQPPEPRQAPRPIAPQVAPRPALPADVEERFWPCERPLASGSQGIYRPALIAEVACHYDRLSAGVDAWSDHLLYRTFDASEGDGDWHDVPPASGQRIAAASLPLDQHPQPGFDFAPAPPELLNPRSYARWQKEVLDVCYRHRPATVYQCRELRATSAFGQDEVSARLAWQQQAREQRDAEKQALRDKYATRFQTLSSKIHAAQQRLAREDAQYDQHKWDTALDVGQTMIGWLMGKRSVARGTAAGRSLSRAAREHSQRQQAYQELERLRQQEQELQEECQAKLHALGERFQLESLTLEPLQIACRKGDMQLKLLAVAWLPWEIDADGRATQLADTR